MHSLERRITTPCTAYVSRIRASPIVPAPCRYLALCLMFSPRLLQTSLTSLVTVGLPLIHRLEIQTPLPRARSTGVPAKPASALSHDSSGIQTGSTPLGHSIRLPWASSHALGAPMSGNTETDNRVLVADLIPAPFAMALAIGNVFRTLVKASKVWHLKTQVSAVQHADSQF